MFDLLRGLDRNSGTTVRIIVNSDLPGTAADFAILDVFLARTAARVKRYNSRLTAVGTGYLGIGVGHRRARKLLVEVGGVIIPIAVIGVV